MFGFGKKGKKGKKAKKVKMEAKVESFQSEALEELGKDKFYAVVIYDKVAQESSSIVLLPKIRLADRLFKASVKSDFFDYDLVVIGIFDKSTMEFDKIEHQTLPMDDLKKKLEQENDLLSKLLEGNKNGEKKV